MIRVLSRIAAVSAASAAAAVLTALATAGPAFADNPLGPSEGADPGPGLGPAAALALFVGVPVLACLLLAAIVLVPGAIRSHRYRPAEGWAARPVWFAGPADPDAATAAANPGDVVRGGASGSW